MIFSVISKELLKLTFKKKNTLSIHSMTETVHVASQICTLDMYFGDQGLGLLQFA